MRDGAACAATAYPDGMAVKVDDAVVYEPDALGALWRDPLADDAVKVTDPLIVVEVLSPSSLARDTGAKLEDYFRLPSVRHYLIVKTENWTVVHHRREDEAAIQTRLMRSGALDLEPPGIIISAVV